MNTQFWSSLGVKRSSLFISDVIPSEWGYKITIVCLYSPHDLRKQFKVVFEGCSRLNWEIFVEADDPPENEADVIAFDLLNENHASITTTLFELVISYRNLTFIKNWDID